jgi:allophanate hydrolase subunit 2
MKGALHERLVDEDVGYHGIIKGSVQTQAEDKPIRDHLFL